MNRIIAFGIVCVMSLCLSPLYLSAETIDRIVAVVNDEPVTQSELDSLLIPIYTQYKSAYAGAELERKLEEARTNVLNQLIEDRLVAQEAKRMEVKVEEQEIDAQLLELKSKFPSEEEFKKLLDQQQMSTDKVRKKLSEQIAIRKLHQYEVRQKVMVSPSEIETYYQEHSDEFSEPEKVKVRTIMIKKKQGIEPGAADEGKQKMQKILEELKAGAAFSDLAKQYSEGMKAQDGGDLGFVKRGELITEFDDTLFNLPVGERSPILETQVGYHVFLIEAKQEKVTKPLSEVKDEIEEILFRTKSKERFSKWIQELKENAYISIK